MRQGLVEGQFGYEALEGAVAYILGVAVHEHGLKDVFQILITFQKVIYDVIEAVGTLIGPSGELFELPVDYHVTDSMIGVLTQDFSEQPVLLPLLLEDVAQEVKEKLDQLMLRQLVTGAHLIALVRMIVRHKQLKKLFLGIFNCLSVLLVFQLVSKVLKVPLEVMDVMGGVRGLLRREKSRHFLDEFAFHNVFLDFNKKI